MARTKQVARTKQTLRRTPAETKARLELKVEASKQIEAWQQANAEAAPTQDGLLARLRARLFGPRRPGVQEVAEPFDILAELPHDLRILVFIEAGPASQARLALASKPWGTLVARTLPQAVPPLPHARKDREGLIQVIKAVASRMHPVEVCLLMRELRECAPVRERRVSEQKCLFFSSDLGHAMAHCAPLYRNEWTTELLLDPFNSFGFNKPGLLSFMSPLIETGGFKETEKLITLVRGAYCESSEEFFDFLVDFHVQHLQKHEAQLFTSFQDGAFFDHYGEVEVDDDVTYNTAEWEEAMAQLGTFVGKESPRLPMQSVLYILKRALDDSWAPAATEHSDYGIPADARMEHRVACFFLAWAPAVDFPTSWPAEDVAAWFKPWCQAKKDLAHANELNGMDDEHAFW